MPKLSYDYFGINDADSNSPNFRDRIATFNKSNQNSSMDFNTDYRNFLGRLFEKSPEMLELLKEYSNLLLDQDKLTESRTVDELINYIEKGKQDDKV